MTAHLVPLTQLLRMGEQGRRDRNSESSGTSSSPPHTPSSSGSSTGAGDLSRPTSGDHDPSPRGLHGVSSETKSLSDSLRGTHLEHRTENRREGRRAPPPRLPLGPPCEEAVPLTRNPSDGRRNINSLLNEPRPDTSSNSASQSTPTTQYFAPERAPRSPPAHVAHPHPHPHHSQHPPQHLPPPMRMEIRYRQSNVGPPSGPMTPTSATVHQYQQLQHSHPHPPHHQHQHLPPQHHRDSIDHQHYPPAYIHDAHGYPPAYQLDIDRRHSYHPGQGAPAYTPGPIRPATSKHQVHRGHPSQLAYHPDGVQFPGDGMRTPISRTTKACDSCRARKVRCNPDPSALIPGTCTRCSEANRECVFTSTQKKRGPAPGKTARSATSANSATRATIGPDETYRERRETWSSSSAPHSHREYPHPLAGPYSAPAHGGEAWPWAPGAQPPSGEPMPRGPPEAPLSAPPTHYYHPPSQYDPRERPPTYDPRERPAETRGHRELLPYDERGEPRGERHHPYPRPPRSAGQERHDSDRRPSVGGWGEPHHQRSGPSTPVYAPAPLSAPLHPSAHYPPQHGPAPPPMPPALGGHGYPPHHAAPPFDPQYTMRPHPASGWPRRDHDHEHYPRGERSPSPRDRRRRD